MNLELPLHLQGVMSLSASASSSKQTLHTREGSMADYIIIEYKQIGFLKGFWLGIEIGIRIRFIGKKLDCKGETLAGKRVKRFCD